MNFLIADTFTDSLARLTGDEQNAVKTTAFDLQMDPSSPGLSFHKLDKAKDKRFWSVRVNADIRLIVHKTDSSLLLCYVDHHDRAYAWAERRKLETHPTTGAAQIIELRESVREIVIPTYVQAAAAPKPVARPLSGQSDEVLLGYGVPAEWLKDVRDADEDGLLALTGYLPAEAAEAVLELATGGTPHVSKAEPAPIGTVPDPFTHPDAQRRFRVVASVDELERAMDAPWDKWAVFLHPEQRQLVTRDFNGPARVAGSAGTGKTVVAFNERLRRLLRNRSKGTVEFKHANISAVLTLHGYPYIDGYKPRFNFQALLEQVLLEYLDVHRDFFDPLVNGPVLNPTASPDADAFDVSRVVEPPPEEMRIPQTVWSPSARLSRFDFVTRDAENRDLGRRGEEFVLEFERKRLHDGGRRDLAQRIEWTAQARGDGAGYDLQSFDADGSTRLIEVKTTGLGKYFPFNVTVNEVRCSQARPVEFHLYRVFNFGPDARLYMLAGELSRSCHLDPTQYRAFVQSPGRRGE